MTQAEIAGERAEGGLDLPVLEAAIARFLSNLQSEMGAAKQALAGCKAIDRAKALLARARSMSEGEAYASPRNTALDQGRKVFDVAAALVTAAIFAATTKRLRFGVRLPFSLRRFLLEHWPLRDPLFAPERVDIDSRAAAEILARSQHLDPPERAIDLALSGHIQTRYDEALRKRCAVCYLSWRLGECQELWIAHQLSTMLGLDVVQGSTAERTCFRSAMFRDALVPMSVDMPGASERVRGRWISEVPWPEVR